MSEFVSQDENGTITVLQTIPASFQSPQFAVVDANTLDVGQDPGTVAYYIPSGGDTHTASPGFIMQPVWDENGGISYQLYQNQEDNSIAVQSTHIVNEPSTETPPSSQFTLSQMSGKENQHISSVSPSSSSCSSQSADQGCPPGKKRRANLNSGKKPNIEKAEASSVVSHTPTPSYAPPKRKINTRKKKPTETKPAIIKQKTESLNSSLSESSASESAAHFNQYTCQSCCRVFAINRLLLQRGSTYAQGIPKSCISCFEFRREAAAKELKTLSPSLDVLQ